MFVDANEKMKNEWMHEWMNKWMNEWMSEWMNEWVNDQSNKRYILHMFGRLCHDERINERFDWIIDSKMNEKKWMNIKWMNEWLNGWKNEWMNEWINK